MKRILITLSLAIAFAVHANAQTAVDKQAFATAVQQMDEKLAVNDVAGAKTNFRTVTVILMEDLQHVQDQINASTDANERAALTAKQIAKQNRYSEIKQLSRALVDNRVTMHTKLTAALNDM
jgi:hypothetical protein